jgi:hypothetical protein
MLRGLGRQEKNSRASIKRGMGASLRRSYVGRYLLRKGFGRGWMRFHDVRRGSGTGLMFGERWNTSAAA